MSRKYTRNGPAADIGAATDHINEYYYGIDTGVYYYSDGSVWTITTFSEGRSVSNRSDAIAVADAAQLIMATNTDRKWFYFQNNSNKDMYLGLGYIPTTSNGILIPQGGASLKLESFVVTDAIYVLCDTINKAFVALEG